MVGLMEGRKSENNFCLGEGKWGDDGCNNTSAAVIVDVWIAVMRVRRDEIT
jgi:hypothetical protein